MEGMSKQSSPIKRKNISEIESTKYSRESSIDNRGTYISQLGIILTEKCNISCRHCALDCRSFQKTELGWSVIERLIRESAALGVKYICFTGGEPFLQLDTLIKAVNLCKVLGLGVSTITNGFWAVSESEAKQIMGKLDGLTTLHISTDVFHQEFVSIDRILNIILSCHELGIDCCVQVCHLNDPISEIESVKKQLASVEGLYTISPQAVLLLGRAAYQIDANSTYSYDLTSLCCRNADAPVIVSNGDVVACCGSLASWPNNHSLLLGNIHNQTLEEINNAANLNPLIHALRLWGPSELVRLIKKVAEKESYSFTSPVIDEMQNICFLCKHIVANPDNTEMLQRALKDPDVWHKIAVGRLIEFNETSMLLEEKTNLIAINS